MMQEYIKKTSTGFLIVIIFVFGFFGGLGASSVLSITQEKQVKDDQYSGYEGKVNNKDAESKKRLHDVDFRLFWEIWNDIQTRYAGEKPSDVELFYGAISGMVGALGDPYSLYFDPASADRFIRELDGEFEGIGAEIGIKQDQLTVIAPLPDTPASRAGLLAGDRIIAIDGKETQGMIVEEAVHLIRGKKGTVVKLFIMRSGFSEPKEFSITRGVIVIQPVKIQFETIDNKKIARISISHFNERVEGLFRDSVRRVLLENGEGIILDLRNNPGGFLDAAVNISGEWIGDNIAVIEEFSDGTVREHRASGSARFADIPTIILVNEGTASAAEILAGALRDHGKAKIIGKKTFGKGSVQDFSEFIDGSALKLTIALWKTPKGHSINNAGITPDKEIDTTVDDFNADRDPQLESAKEALFTPIP